MIPDCPSCNKPMTEAPYLVTLGLMQSGLPVTDEQVKVTKAWTCHKCGEALLTYPGKLVVSHRMKQGTIILGEPETPEETLARIKQFERKPNG